MACIHVLAYFMLYNLLSCFFPKQVLDKVRDLLKDVDLFDDFYKCEFINYAGTGRLCCMLHMTCIFQ